MSNKAKNKQIDTPNYVVDKAGLRKVMYWYTTFLAVGVNHKQQMIKNQHGHAITRFDTIGI